jgi:hypothetical protein
MSKAKAKGTTGENEIVDLLVDAGFPRADPEDPASVGVERFQGGYESHDLHFKNMLTDWVIEVKYRKAWHLFGWVRKIRRRANGRVWAIFGIHGDRRTTEGKEVGVLCVMDARVAADLIYFWEKNK